MKWRSKTSYLLIVIVSAALSSYWLNHQPRAARRHLEPAIPLVETIEPRAVRYQTRIQAFGTVQPAQSVSIAARVEGVVVAIGENYIEGGLVKQNEELVRLDPTDYELKLKQAQSDLVRARFNLKLEQGQQAVAKLEYEMLGNNLDALGTELVQRKPHLEASKAALHAVEAALRQAELNLARTRVVAPFDAVVTERNVGIGSRVSTSATGATLANLVATESFWIDVSLPVDQLRWVDIPGFNADRGASVKITFENGWGPGAYRSGRVKRLKVAVEPEGRMAKLIVEVDDPLSLKPSNRDKPPLMLNTLVRVEIAGKFLENAIPLPETALHDGCKVWLMKDEQTLDIIEITPLWSEKGKFFLGADQLPPNVQIVASNLPAPVSGMPIRKAGDDSSPLMTGHADETFATYAD